MEFAEFPKIARLRREIIVTEKIDGTNACIGIVPAAELEGRPFDPKGPHPITLVDEHYLYAGSRSRWLSVNEDNHGFAKWTLAYAHELVNLGPGRHFGEWWGSGIQRGYGLPSGEKRLSFFNVHRWCLHGQTPQTYPTENPLIVKTQDVLPPCVGLVPILYRGVFDTAQIEAAIRNLKEGGSVAGLGFMKPEGIVVFHAAGNVGFKQTIEKDEIPKAKQR